MDSAMLMNISDQQIDDALNDESGERVGKLNRPSRNWMQKNAP